MMVIACVAMFSACHKEIKVESTYGVSSINIPMESLAKVELKSGDDVGYPDSLFLYKYEVDGLHVEKEKYMLKKTTGTNYTVTPTIYVTRTEKFNGFISSIEPTYIEAAANIEPALYSDGEAFAIYEAAAMSDIQQWASRIEISYSNGSAHIVMNPLKAFYNGYKFKSVTIKDLSGNVYNPEDLEISLKVAKPKFWTVDDFNYNEALAFYDVYGDGLRCYDYIIAGRLEYQNYIKFDDIPFTEYRIDNKNLNDHVFLPNVYSLTIKGTCGDYYMDSTFKDEVRELLNSTSCIGGTNVVMNKATKDISINLNITLGFASNTGMSVIFNNLTETEVTISLEI